jgi:hypothetical protein
VIKRTLSDLKATVPGEDGSGVLSPSALKRSRQAARRFRRIKGNSLVGESKAERRLRRRNGG